MVHLHTHSMYSLRDSIIKPEDLIARLKEIGQDTVAVTDHGECLGTVEIYKLCKSNGVKPIIGVEFYVCDDLNVKDKNSKYYHLVALCKNETGRLNMNKLISLSERPENKYYKPRIDFDLLSEYGEGLVILSACLAGEVSKSLLSNDYDNAKKIALKYKERFGDDYYLEIQAHRDPEQIAVNRQIVQLAQETGVQCVVTCDAHYTREEDRVYQNKYAFNGAYKEDGESYIDCFVQSEWEVRERIDYLDTKVIDDSIKTTHAIADKCNAEIPLSAPIMPKMSVPEEFPDSKSWLMSICENGFKTKLNIDVKNRAQADPQRKIFQKIMDENGEVIGYQEKDLSKETIEEYLQRYEYELDSLSRMGFLDYMLLVYSYANVAKRRGIARGSGGGSLICYVSNITNIDPLEHKLYFERFIDVGALPLLESGEITPSELKIPDIDLDFSGESCAEVMRFLYDTYGEKRVASIGKFGTNKTKGTIRDMCKVLDIDLQSADEIAKSFENFEIDEIDAMISGEMDVVPSAKAAMGYVKTHPELFDFVRKLNGLPKSFGLHACGKIIANNELDYYLPSSYDADGIRFLQGDMHSVEDVGLVKIDVLGLRTLDQEYDTLEMSGETAEFINPKQDYGDPKVLDVFRNGDTLGIFQFSSNGMKQTLKKMNVSGIDDLSVANALFRPGSMSYIDNYCNRKNGKEEFSYLHPDLEGILNNTYGIIVFQEQLIEIGRLAGMHNPDLLRKATGKKNPKLLAQVKPELEEKLKARGWSDEQFAQLWSDMLEFSHYSFNKCVSGKTKILRPMARNSVWHPTVEEMYLTKNSLEYAKEHGKLPLRSKYNRCGYGIALSMYEDGRIRKNTIVDIQPSGVRETITLSTESGAEITCTTNHKFPTPNGTMLAGDLTIGGELYLIGEYEKTKSKYNFTNGEFEKNFPKSGERGFQVRPYGASAIFKKQREWFKKHKSPCQICGAEYSQDKRFELHHKDGDRSNNLDNNLCWCCNSCHKKDQYKIGRTKTFEKGVLTRTERIVSITTNPPETTYDLTMAGPAHNFVVDSGIVTCNSHAAAYAILAYITAKQKAYYPAEFYAGLCNSYIGQSSFVKDNADEIVGDMFRHKINIEPFTFRDDHRKCWAKGNKVVYAIPLIRDCNQVAADILYEFRNSEHKYFWALCNDMMKAGLEKSKLKILIMLGFFNEYGNSKELLRVMDIFEFFKFGDRSSIKVSQVVEDGFMNVVIPKYSVRPMTKSGELAKTYKELDIPQIMNAYEDKVLSVGISEFSYRDLMATQNEYLGFIALTTGREEDRAKLRVKGVLPLCRKSDGKQFGYSVITKSIGSGIEARFTVFNRVFNKSAISEGDVILCKEYQRDGPYFTLLDYEHIF